jgi:CubicO group peptidase (beta-lactamase class C family)
MIKISAARRLNKLATEVRGLMKQLHVPGVVVGVCHKGKERYRGFGVANAETGVPADEDTLFQVGSISKTFLAQASVMLAEAGKLDLDAPVKRYLPELRLKSRTAQEKVTMRHLLTHTGGWFGDYFNDLGAGNDALSRMVEQLASLPQITPFGSLWSYNNAGFYLAGRVVEKISGKPYEAVIKEMIFGPLGMTNSWFFAEDVISRRFAVGHNHIKGKIRVARPWAMGRAVHPAGGITCSARDLMKYARFHMGDGRLPGGKRLLSAKGMAALHSPLLHATGQKSMALSWFVTRVDGLDTISHSGGTNGQQTDLRVIPAEKFASLVFTNGSYSGGILAAVGNGMLREFFSVRPPARKTVGLPSGELRQYCGRYATPDFEVNLSVSGKGLLLKMTDKGGFPTPDSKPELQPPPSRASFHEADKITLLDAPYKDSPAEFIRGRNGKVAHLRLFSRIYPRTSR